MKTIQILVLMCLTILTADSCKKKKKVEAEPQKYTIKGHVFYKTPTSPLQNQELSVDVYKKGFLKDWDFVTTLGTVTTDANGYFEFSYPYQKEGIIINLDGQFTDNKYNKINSNIDQNFYNSTSSTVALFVNTNNKLTSGDTFYLNYQDNYAQWHIDSIFGNHTGLFKTFRSVSVNLRVNAGKGHSGFPVNSDLSGFTSKPELILDFPLKADPYIDSVYLNY